MYMLCSRLAAAGDWLSRAWAASHSCLERGALPVYVGALGTSALVVKVVEEAVDAAHPARASGVGPALSTNAPVVEETVDAAHRATARVVGVGARRAFMVGPLLRRRALCGVASDGGPRSWGSS